VMHWYAAHRTQVLAAPGLTPRSDEQDGSRLV